MRVVIDTNVMFISVLKHSPIYPIYRSLLDGELCLCFTNEIALEYEEIFQNKLGEYYASIFLENLYKLPNKSYIETYYKWRLITQDPDDNKFVDCAIAGNTDYIITEDKHFNVLKNHPFPEVNVISAMDFIDNHLKQ